MKELDEIDQLFQTTFEEFELTPDAFVKENIDRAIASKKKRRRFLFILLPIIFGATTLTSTLFFYSSSGKLTSNKKQLAQNQPSEKGPNHTTFLTKIVNPDESKGTIAINETDGEIFTQKRHTQKSIFETSSSTVKIKSTNRSKNKITLAINQKTSLSDAETLRLSELKKQNAPLDEPLALTENQTQSKPEKDIPVENKQDSVVTDLLTDSINDHIAETAETPILALEAEKNSRKWSLSILSGWENESKRPSERFDSTTFSGISTEFAQIQTTTFYGKIEFNRKLSNRFDAIVGLGFRSSKVKQIGSLYSLDSFSTTGGVGSIPVSDSFAYFINNQRRMQTYQVNSIIVPLGISFSIPISDRFNFRLSGGTEFAYGWIANNQPTSVLSDARFRPFGWNIWLRPEIHYTIGRVQLFGFESFNHALHQQLKWDFVARRNPSFGAGIGVLIQL